MRETSKGMVATSYRFNTPPPKKNNKRLRGEVETSELGRRSSSRWSESTKQTPGKETGPLGPRQAPAADGLKDRAGGIPGSHLRLT